MATKRRRSDAPVVVELMRFRCHLLPRVEGIMAINDIKDETAEQGDPGGSEGSVKKVVRKKTTRKKSAGKKKAVKKTAGKKTVRKKVVRKKTSAKQSVKKSTVEKRLPDERNDGRTTATSSASPAEVADSSGEAIDSKFLQVDSVGREAGSSGGGSSNSSMESDSAENLPLPGAQQIVAGNTDLEARMNSLAEPSLNEQVQDRLEEMDKMSSDSSEVKGLSPSQGILAGFWPKVIVGVVLVVAGFMYIRSLAQQEQMTPAAVAGSDSPAEVGQPETASGQLPHLSETQQPVQIPEKTMSEETIIPESGIGDKDLVADSVSEPMEPTREAVKQIQHQAEPLIIHPEKEAASFSVEPDQAMVSGSVESVVPPPAEPVQAVLEGAVEIAVPPPLEQDQLVLPGSVEVAVLPPLETPSLLEAAGADETGIPEADRLTEEPPEIPLSENIGFDQESGAESVVSRAERQLTPAPGPEMESPVIQPPDTTSSSSFFDMFGYDRVAPLVTSPMAPRTRKETGPGEGWYPPRWRSHRGGIDSTGRYGRPMGRVPAPYSHRGNLYDDYYYRVPGRASGPTPQARPYPQGYPWSGFSAGYPYQGYSGFYQPEYHRGFDYPQTYQGEYSPQRGGYYPYRGGYTPYR
ncbi:MAG: hypothetical protein GY703_08615 [Gammaproteobacteria bacterium]|nr:hypothetical protein [Gammaproteobacteria bacterium]